MSDTELEAALHEHIASEYDIPEWEPSPDDLNVLYDMRRGTGPDHEDWRVRYQRGTRLA